MSRVTLDTTLDPIAQAGAVQAMHFKDLPSADQRANALAKQVIPQVELASERPTSLAGRDIAQVAQTGEQDPRAMLEALKKQHASALEQAKLRGDKPRINYLAQMSQLIAELSTLFNEWTSRDNTRIHEKKTQYRQASGQLEDNAYSRGFWNLGFGFVSVAITLTAQGLEGPFNHFTQSFNQYLAAHDTRPSQNNSLILQELQKLNDSSTSTTATLDLARNIQQKIDDWFKAATRA